MSHTTVSSLLKRLLPLFLAGFLLNGCASLPEDYPRTTSTAIANHESTAIGNYFAKEAARHPGKSGFAIIRYGRPAFTSRVALAELAEKSLDLQYYIWEPDATGQILAERLIRAADRGVKIRLLLDDINLKGRDAKVAALDAHPNIEIRLFNPFANRGMPALGFLTEFNRVNHRMHNKLMIMDNAVAIVGGRNIGNHYFNVAQDANFRDLDIAAGGPVVRDTSSVFDHFWNGEWSVPINALMDREYDEKDLRSTREWLKEQILQADYPYPLDQDVATLKSELKNLFDDFIWAPGKIVWDDPATLQREGQTSELMQGLVNRLGRVEKELLIESAYFVPRDTAVVKFKELVDSGARVRILTNSLASNDVLAAHAGYAKRREKIVAAGVELYEFRPFPEAVSKNVVAGSSKAALHTKAVVFDRKDVFIGSLNLDPRSLDINTEAGLYVESPELARQVIAYLDEGVTLEKSYRVELDEDGDLSWVTLVDGKAVRYNKDPDSSGMQRFTAGFIKMLPVEDQL
ncbi:MAG: phospholipase D family protein [Gammaproteobacteria bacterium]